MAREVTILTDRGHNRLKAGLAASPRRLFGLEFVWWGGLVERFNTCFVSMRRRFDSGSRLQERLWASIVQWRV